MKTNRKPSRFVAPRSKLNRALLAFVADAGKGLLDSAQLYSDFLNYQRAVWRHGWDYAHELKAIHKERELRYRFYLLRRRRYLAARRVGKRIVLKLTARGQLALALDRVRRASDVGTVRTVVIFDVPESQRFVRRQLRLLLRQVGFTRLQQSVWVRRGDALQVTRSFVNYLGAQPWVTVLRTFDLV